MSIYRKAVLIKDAFAESISCQYVWGARPGHRDELILRDSASPDSESSGEFLDERLWCLMDYYDPTSIVDNSGSVVERYRFSAFGLRSVMDLDFSPRIISGYAWDFAFKGQFIDLDTGYYNYGYRYYSPKLGRWLSRDPIGENGGLNTYRLLNNNAINSNDLFGLVQLDPVKTFKVDYSNEEYAGSDGAVSIPNRFHVDVRIDPVQPEDPSGPQKITIVSAATQVTYYKLPVITSKPHEDHHLSDWQSSWAALIAQANKLDGFVATCPAEANCWAEVLFNYEGYYHWEGKKKAYELHVNGATTAEGVKIGAYPAYAIQKEREGLEKATTALANIDANITKLREQCMKLKKAKV